MLSMLSIQAKPAEIVQSGVDGDRPHAIADAVSQIFGQVRIETDLRGLIDDIRHRKDKADFEANRPGISCVILLAHSMGLVEEAEIDQAVAVGWETVYRLYQESVGKITEHLSRESISIAGDGLDHSDFEALSIEMSKTQDEGIILVVSAYPRFSQFSLLDMDRDLAKAVAGCLKWIIENGGIGVFVEDLYCGGFMEEELFTLSESLESESELSELSNFELAEFFLRNEVYPFNEITDDEEYLEERIDYLKSVLSNNYKSTFVVFPEIHEIRTLLIRWRRENKILYENPWVRFIRETIKVWKWIERLGMKNPNGQNTFDGYGDVYLDYGHAIGFGFDWEELLVSEVYENMAQAGEIPSCFIELKPLACREISEKLTLLAKSIGLIRLAEIISINEEEKGKN